MPQSKSVSVPATTDEVTFRSCTTEVFRWVRKGIALAEETPTFIRGCAEDVQKAWEDSAKR